MNWKVHSYFVISRRWHPEISFETAVKALENAETRLVQPNGRIRVWGFVEELGYYVRVVLLEVGETIFNAFIDGEYTKRRKP